MFFNPAKTGLVVLGASEFSQEPELNRRVFRNARDEVVSYFRNPSKGLGLHSKNIFDGFDLDLPKGELIQKIDQFLYERELADVFVYICSHGKSQESILRFFLSNSAPDDEDTWVNFERFFDRIEQTALCRIYCVIDCCVSGVVHRHSLEISISPEAAAYVSNAETLALPRRGSVILTANNAANVGAVYAHDSLPGVDLPLFTHCFLELLKNGNASREGYGLSAEQVHDDLLQRIPETIGRINEDLQNQGLDTISDEHQTMVPEFSDRPVFDTENGNIISRIGIFPNNDARHELASRVSRSIRINYDRVSRQYDRIQELEAAVEPLEARVESLEAEIRRLNTEEVEPRSQYIESLEAEIRRLNTDEVEPQKQKIESLEKTKIKIESDIEILKINRTTARRFAAIMSVVVIAAVLALVFDFDPALDLRRRFSE